MNESDDILDIMPEKEADEQSLIEYDITTYPSDFTLSGLHGLWNNNSIVIPDYQRDFVWTINQSSLLIESFLIGLPVPPVFFYIDDENKNLVIDGQQRLLSIFYFFEGYFGRENEKGKRQVFRLTGLNEKNPFFNKTYEGLDDKTKRKFEGAVLRAINIRQLKPKDGSTSVYYIFERLNTGGTPLKPQEIRNCVYRGSFLKTLRKLNENSNWREILGKPIPDKHQSDVELILRAFGLCYDLSRYEKPMKQFLNFIAEKYQNEKKKAAEFEKNFIKAAEIIRKKLPKKPFAARGPLNTSIFDSIFCIILSNVDNLPENIDTRYESLLRDKNFIDYTTQGTSDERVLKKRFEYVRSFLIG